MLGDQQQESLILFMDAIAALCAPFQDSVNIPLLEEQLSEALALLERDFPVSLQVNRSKSIVVHVHPIRKLYIKNFLLSSIEIMVWQCSTIIICLYVNK